MDPSINENRDLNLRHPTLVGVSRRRFVYAGLVLTMALLVVFLFCMSLAIKGFRSVQAIEVRPIDWGSIALNDVRQLVVDAVKVSTTDESLVQLLSAWKLTLTASNRRVEFDVAQVDCSKLRERLTFAIDEDAQEGKLTLHLGYLGRGDSDERAFLKLLVDDVAGQLAEAGKPTATQLASLRYDSTLAQRARETHRKLINRARDQLDAIRAQTSAAKALVQSQLAKKTASDSNQSAGVDKSLANLQVRLGQLKEQRDQLLTTLPSSHPDVITVRKKIEELEAELLGERRDKSQTIKSAFVQASYARDSDQTDLASLAGTIDTISTDPLDSAIQSCDENWKQAIDSIEKSALAMNSVLDKGSVLLVERGSFCQSAVGLAGGAAFLTALLTSLLVGLAVASRLDVWTFDQGFKSVAATAESLGVPVFAFNSPQPKTQQKAVQSRSAMLLKLGETILFTILLVVAGMFLIDAEFRTLVLENPMHVFARLIWMIKG